MKNQPILLVRNINNLTDARYFAALLPQYLATGVGLDLNDTEVKISEIQRWIEGPQWALELTPNVGEEAIDRIKESNLQISAIIGRQNQIEFFKDTSLLKICQLTKSPSHEEVLEIADLFIIPSKVSVFEGVRHYTSKPILVEICSTAEYLEIQSIREKINGVVLVGGEEEKVGLKSFDDMDEIVELIFT